MTKVQNGSLTEVSYSHTPDPAPKKRKLGQGLATVKNTCVQPARHASTVPLSPAERKHLLTNASGYTTPFVHDRYSPAHSEKGTCLDGLDLARSISPGTERRAAALGGAGQPSIIDVFPRLRSMGAQELAALPHIEIIERGEDCVIARQWPTDRNGKEFARTTLIVNDGRLKDQAVFFEKIFGNVDVILSPRLANSSTQVRLARDEDITILKPDMLARITAQLTEGQRLNIDHLATNLGMALPTWYRPGDAARLSPLEKMNLHYLAQFNTLAQTATNGASMLPGVGQNGEIAVLHQTNSTALEAMKNSQTINVSKAGCMGRTIYATYVAHKDGQDFVGGHTEAMAARDLRAKHARMPGPQPLADKIAQANDEIATLRAQQRIPEGNGDARFILFISEHLKGNKTTNWLERFGNGSLYLEASQRMHGAVSHDKTAGGAQALAKIEAIKDASVQEYAGLYRFLSDIIGLSDKQLASDSPEPLSTRDFDTLWNSLTATRERYPTLINNVLFEGFKDFVMLHNKGDEKHQKLKSFDMDQQYNIIFDLFPDMLTNWDTVKFSPSLEQMKTSIEKHDPTFDMDHFKQNLMQSLLFYAGNRLLGGEQPKNPALMHSFDDLGKAHPNLAGVLYHYLGAGLFKNTAFFDQYLEHIGDCETNFLRNTGIQTSVKAGFFGTEELGVTGLGHTKAFAPAFVHSGGETKVFAEEKLPIEISRQATNRSGFTQRSTPAAKDKLA